MACIHGCRRLGGAECEGQDRLHQPHYQGESLCSSAVSRSGITRLRCTSAVAWFVPVVCRFSFPFFPGIFGGTIAIFKGTAVQHYDTT